MRPFLLAACVTALLAVAAAPAGAHPSIQLDPTLPADLTHSATDNVTYLGRFPEHTGTAGGRVGPAGDRFYVTDPRGVYVYDITTPESPDLLGSIALFQTGTGVALAQEDPDTNDEVLLVDAAPSPGISSRLHVVDVSDPSNLSVLSTLNVTDHTWTCVTGIDDEGETNTCAYAYGRTGHIVDLTDPSAPELLPRTWREAVGYGTRSNSPYTHDLTEVRPGLVISAGSTAILMDTTDPATPARLTAIEQPGRFPSLGYHSAEWARGGADRHLVLGTEIAPSGPTNLAGSDCEGESSVIETWDTRSVVDALEAYEQGAPASEAFADAAFTKLDAYDAGGRGLFLDGQAPGHVLYCAHWMEQHPDYKKGGLVVASYYDRGTRFISVDNDGTMSEVGWITPAEGYSGSAQWISDDVVYIMDYRRGMEVVRFSGEPATGVRRASPDAIAVGSAYVPRAALNLDTAGSAAAAGFVILMLGAARPRRRRS